MNSPSVKVRNQSIITGRENLVSVWNLPNLPFTEFFGTYDTDFPEVNQMLMYCPDSGVFQLSCEVDPFFLYHSQNYNFRTLKTPKIERELEFLINSASLRELLSPKSRILEIGGNNFVMAEKLEGHYSDYVVCDPILEESVQGTRRTWGGLIEDNLVRVRKFQPDVIIGRHVLEHVSSPLEMLRSVIKSLSHQVVFIFEFPNFRLMQKRQRLDAIFHQHLNYFDESSTVAMIKALGCEILSLQSNHLGSNGGSLVVSFTNRRVEDSPTSDIFVPSSVSSREQFERSLGLFQHQNLLLEKTIREWSGRKVGYGAGLMLSTLNYHLHGAINRLEAIFDDDFSKSGTQYRNLKPTVHSSDQLVDDESNLIVVTSMENQRAIRSKLRDFPKSTVVGFQIN